jgi:hypothetical protein
LSRSSIGTLIENRSISIVTVPASGNLDIAEELNGSEAARWFASSLRTQNIDDIRKETLTVEQFSYFRLLAAHQMAQG